MLVVVVADVEAGAEHLDVESVGRDDEGRLSVVLHLEIGFAVHLHAAFARKERSDVLDAAGGVEPDLGAVLQLHAQVLSRRHFERRRPPRPLSDPVVGKHPRETDADDRHRGQLRGITHDAAQRNATQ